MRSQLETTPPYSGADMVADANEALQSIATSFAGPTDPAAMAWPYATWADTGNMLLKRRNAANTDWVTIGPLLSYGSAALNFKAAPSTADDEVVVQSQVAGVGQTRQDMTEFRASDVTYINTGTKPIKIILTGASSAPGQYFRLRNGELTVTYGVFWASTIGNFSSGEITILPGESYRLDTSIPLGWKWWEIR